MEQAKISPAKKRKNPYMAGVAALNFKPEQDWEIEEARAMYSCAKFPFEVDRILFEDCIKGMQKLPRDFHSSTGWQGSRSSLSGMEGENDFIGPLKRIYKKAFEIIQKIRDAKNPANYDVFYVYGDIGKPMTVEARESEMYRGRDITTIQSILNNGGSFEVMLYELQNPGNQYPSYADECSPGPLKSQVFEHYSHLWDLLD
ncbi:MAG: hypothetical protein JW839_01050 [Candidatus Lokiarchaeota archaeon]|nr:hypothetical protein [Candidatus Lokiarchaeota archaeon]